MICRRLVFAETLVVTSSHHKIPDRFEVFTYFVHEFRKLFTPLIMLMDRFNFSAYDALPAKLYKLFFSRPAGQVESCQAIFQTIVECSRNGTIRQRYCLKRNETNVQSFSLLSFCLHSFFPTTKHMQAKLKKS